MKRRTEIKLENMKLFSKKYVFSGRYIVRNTLCVLALAAITGAAVFAADVIGDVKVSTASVVKAVETEEVTTEATEEKAPEEYVVKLSDSSVIEMESLDALYTCFEEDGVVQSSANAAEYLMQSETDMTGRYIVTTEALYLRAEASQEGNILAVLYTGDTGKVVGTDGDWTMIVSGDEEGYVKSEYIIVDEEATEIAKKAAEDKKSLRDTIGVDESIYAQAATEAPTESATTSSTSSTDTSTQSASTEPSTQAATQATTEATTQAPSYEASSSDLYLLAAIVFGEAGNQSYEGQLAVASVVMNRLHNGAWGNTISSVIYAPNQFAATSTAAFQNALVTGGSDTCLQAAQAALNGENNVGSYMSFRPTWAINTSTLSSYIQIGDHIFF
ncbi:MAG: cell wall hydrolase [Eubacterium sp.]|nr:cell wall hydrolase [Eubacterium sp.]